MFLKRIKLTNIRSIKELDLSFAGADGASASGRSCSGRTVAARRAS